MREMIIYLIMVIAVFGIPIFLLKLMLKFFPEKPDKKRTASVMENTDTEEIIPDDRIKRAILARLVEAQALTDNGPGRVEQIRTLEGHRNICGML